MVPGRSWVRRLASVAACCPGVLLLPVARSVARPVVRRLLMVAGVAAAGWLLGVVGQAHAGQAHADTVPGVPLPGGAAQAAPVTALADHVLPKPGVVTAVRTVGTVLAPARPPAILALPPAATSALADATRPHTPAGSAGPSQTRRHGDTGSGAGVAGAPVSHIGPRAVTGASEKVSVDRPVARKAVRDQAHKKAHKKARRAASGMVHQPLTPRQPRPAPQRGQALPPSAKDGGVHQVGVRRGNEPGTARSRPAFLIAHAGTVPPAVRTAADEPSFSPD